MQQVCEEVRSLWYSCIIVGATLCDRDIGLYVNTQTVRPLSLRTSKIRDLMKNLDSKVSAYNTHWVSKDHIQGKRSAIASFAAEITKGYSSDLGHFTQIMSQWSFYLQAVELGL